MNEKAIPILGAIVLVLISNGCVAQVPLSGGNDSMPGEKISFLSSDGITIIGTLWKNPNTTKPPLILVHQLGKDRHTFNAFASAAFAKGFTILSFDVRGHGESTRKSSASISYTSFSDVDFQKVEKDIANAKDFLRVEKVMVIGASIGANAALNFAAAHENNCSGIVLLSPGLNFRGIETTDASKTNQCPLFIIASSEDSYSASSAQTILQNSPIEDKKILILNNSGHGTDMLQNDSSLQKKVLDWVESHS